MKKHYFLLVVFLSAWCYQVNALSGKVKDKRTLNIVQSALVIVINQETQECDSVYTDASGFWDLDDALLGLGNRLLSAHSLKVSQNYPNPFSRETYVQFSIPATGNVDVIIHDASGTVIQSKSVFLTSGNYGFRWSGTTKQGIYFYSVAMNSKIVTKKMLQYQTIEGEGSIEVFPFAGKQFKSTESKIPVKIITEKFGYYPDTSFFDVNEGSYIETSIQTVHDYCLMTDLHNDVLMKCTDENYHIENRHSYNHTDIPRLRDGGVDIQVFAVYNNNNSPYFKALEMIDAFDYEMIVNDDKIQQARTAQEAIQIHEQGKIAAVIAIEGGHQIEGDTTKLRDFYDAGARYMTITWNNSTNWAISAQDSRSGTQGLSDYGRDIIRKMDELGMIIDVSHTGIKTIEDILDVTQNPIIASHSGVRAINNHYRNLYDEQIVAIANSGGVIGVVFYPYFLTGGSASISDVVEHINYIVDLVGVEHVAIGSDFDGIGVTPSGLKDVSDFPALTEALLLEGYTIDEVDKIMGKNFLRVFKQVCNKPVSRHTK